MINASPRLCGVINNSAQPWPFIRITSVWGNNWRIGDGRERREKMTEEGEKGANDEKEDGKKSEIEPASVLSETKR